jgi:hypothetical protein
VSRPLVLVLVLNHEASTSAQQQHIFLFSGMHEYHKYFSK